MFVLIVLLAVPLTGNTRITSFTAAKRLLEQVYRDRNVTFYCGCRYRGRRVDRDACSYRPRNWANPRAERIEWEHVVPASAFGRSFREWRDGDARCERKRKRTGGKKKKRKRRYRGRNCARRNPEFARMEADMHNLVPAIGELNQYRGSLEMGEVSAEARRFGDCDVEAGVLTFEPPPDVRGDIARIYQYMDLTYPKRGIVSNKRRKLYEAWSRTDPVDRWECERNRRITTLQGNGNRIVTVACLKAKL
jgi:deoxyribonuclease-1